jgi:anti-sigma B factor antagonist
MTPFSFTVTPVQGRLVVALRGELDAVTSPEFTTSLLELADGPDVILDLGGLSHLDSSGISAFIAVHRRATRQGGVLALTRVPPFVSRVLTLTQLDRVIPVLDVA